MHIHLTKVRVYRLTLNDLSCKKEHYATHPCEFFLYSMAVHHWCSDTHQQHIPGLHHEYGLPENKKNCIDYHPYLILQTRLSWYSVIPLHQFQLPNHVKILHRSSTATSLRNGWATEIQVIGKRDFSIFDHMFYEETLQYWWELQEVKVPKAEIIYNQTNWDNIYIMIQNWPFLWRLWHENGIKQSIWYHTRRWGVFGPQRNKGKLWR